MSSQIDNRAIKKALNKVNNSEKLNRSLKKRSEDYQVEMTYSTIPLEDVLVIVTIQLAPQCISKECLLVLLF